MSEYDNQEQHSNPWEDETLPEQLKYYREFVRQHAGQD